MRVYLVTLGCPKNEVDSAGMAVLLQRDGHVLVEEPAAADVLIVNTCGFIAPARTESLGMLEELAQEKRENQKLIAAGCMAGLYADQLDQVAGVDALLETTRWPEVARLVAVLAGGRPRDVPSDPLEDLIGLSSVCGGSAYLKIADGCDARCAFCTIPRIKGPYRSISQQALVAEAQALVEAGVREIVLVAQDTTYYGRDLGMADGLPGLVEAILDEVPGLPWLRIMYTYPGHITPRLIEVIARSPQVCPYLDMPLQHAHPATLRRMGRPVDVKDLRDLLHHLREGIPDLVLRTTFIVGYPGETEEEFAVLRDFVQEQAFERVGVFPYFCEDGTAAARLRDPVTEETALGRRDELMRLQQEIALDWGRRQVGRTVGVLVEGIGEGGLVVGRTRWDAPEVDGLVLAQGYADIGEMVRVKLTTASAYDLWGELVPHQKP
jgi:ribosomal protein S12 methylthiotransferase